MKEQTWVVIGLAAALIISGGFLALFISENPGNESNGRDDANHSSYFKLAEGEYAEYKNVEETSIYFNWTTRYTLHSFDQANMVRWENLTASSGVSAGSNSWTLPVNFTFGFYYDIEHPLDLGVPYTVTYVGIENTSTLWGMRTSTHYHLKVTSMFESDFWVHNGVTLKLVTQSDNPEYAEEWVLISTNIPEVTHQ